MGRGKPSVGDDDHTAELQLLKGEIAEQQQELGQVRDDLLAVGVKC